MSERVLSYHDRVLKTEWTGRVDQVTGHRQALVTLERYNRATNRWDVKVERMWVATSEWDSE